MVFKKKVCPHCNKKIKYFSLISKKSNVYYYCENCKNYSFLKLDSKIRYLFLFLALLSFIVIFVFSFILKMLLLGSIFITLLFSIFYLLIPVFMSIKADD